MVRRTLIVILLAGLAVLAGCEITPAPVTPLAVTPDVVTVVPYEIASTGLFTVEVELNDQGPFSFIVDTGATISILFESTARRLSIPTDTGETTIVHGIIASSEKPVTRLDSLKLGNITGQDLRVAILEDRQGANNVAGIVGMDILRDYVLVFDRGSMTMAFYRPATFNPGLVNRWRQIPLSENPYSEENYGLHFLDFKLTGDPVPAVFDLGSGLSIVNWTAAQNPTLRRYRRRLRENWEIEGAIGEFEPTALVRFETVRSKTYTWEAWDIYVTDMDTVNIVGAVDQPLMIAGADMFRDTSFAVDFQNQRLWVKSSDAHKEDRHRDRPMTGTRTKANTGVYKRF